MASCGNDLSVDLVVANNTHQGSYVALSKLLIRVLSFWGFRTRGFLILNQGRTSDDSKSKAAREAGGFVGRNC